MMMSFSRRFLSLAVIACALAAPAMAPTAARAVERLVTVSGDATVAVAPDTAMIRLGVTSQGKNAREASDTNAKLMTALLARTNV